MAAYTPRVAQVEGRAFLSELFTRPHATRAKDAEQLAEHTLFVLNVPQHVSADALAASLDGERAGARLAGAAGISAPSESRSAYVGFSSAGALNRALAGKEPLQLPAVNGKTRAARRQRRDQLQEAVGKFMDEFEAVERKREAEDAERQTQMDADGCATRHPCCCAQPLLL
jgi:hypothetical protein